MALTHVYVTFTMVPTFNEFDTAFRIEWADLKSKNTNDSYRMWGDEALIPVWADLVSGALAQGVELPDRTVRCLEIMELEQEVVSGDIAGLDESNDLYPVPVASLELV